MAIPPPFSPGNCLLGWYKTAPHTVFPWMGYWSVGNYVGYLNGALQCHFNQTGLDVWGHYTYLSPTQHAVINLQRFFGLPVNGNMSSDDWNVVQWGTAGFPT